MPAITFLVYKKKISKASILPQLALNVNMNLRVDMKTSHLPLCLSFFLKLLPMAAAPQELKLAKDLHCSPLICKLHLKWGLGLPLGSCSLPAGYTPPSMRRSNCNTVRTEKTRIWTEG